MLLVDGLAEQMIEAANGPWPSPTVVALRAIHVASIVAYEAGVRCTSVQGHVRPGALETGHRTTAGGNGYI